MKQKPTPLFTREQLEARQALPLDIKIGLTKNRIRDWYERWNGLVYVSFSGGKDSTVLLDLVRQDYPDVPAVFLDTGLEYPEIRDFVETIDNVEWIKPQRNFRQVIQEDGYPVVGKEVAKKIWTMQNPTDQNAITRDSCINSKIPMRAIPKKWRYLINSGVKISHKCCNVFKKNPAKQYERGSGRKPFIGSMAAESRLRAATYYMTGCNNFKSSRPISTPLSFWFDDDIWQYIKENNLPYSEIYNMGYERTGCMFCMFGVHLEREPNRFQLMQQTHPKQYDYCINKLGLGKVLDLINVDYVYRPTLFS